MLKSPVGLEAIAEAFNRWSGLARLKQLPIPDLFGAVAQLQAVGAKRLVADLYKIWVAYNTENPALYAAYFNYGIALSDLRDHAAAIDAFRHCMLLKPDFHPVYINLGRALEDSGQSGPAVAQWMQLSNRLAAVTGESVSHKVTALHQTARVLEGLNSDAAAEDALRQSLEINPAQVEAMQHYISLRQRQCKWPALQTSERISRKDLQTGISSLSLSNLADDPMFQLAKAYQYAKSTIGRPRPVALGVAANRRDQSRLRIGYVSSDLREHAVGFAMTDVMETHDRKHFEIFAYYCGINRTDATQQRTIRAVDHWVDINALDDDQAAAKIAEHGIDILIDLNGYTKDARTKVFARRPAPIAVNWFGFPGTMGTPYHHYIVADPTIIPPHDEIYYSEKVLRLPCYQPNDRKRIVAERRPTRTEAGLPEDAFVYCSLNGMQKITPRVFERWMTILGRVPGSVLWLLSGTTAEANERLRQAAVERGVAGERLVFAEKMPNPDHLARYPLADLFLDSMPYGAHTTAADSLWMNVPILTLPGRSFASRVCTSLIRAAGVGELECSSPEDYVARAVEYGQNRDKLAALKAKLAVGRDTCALFDTPKLVRHLEDLYRQMWSDFRNCALPEPDLRNLDIYHDIGVGLELEKMDTLSDDAYLALYRDKLADWDACYPVRPDGRLWLQTPPAAAVAPKVRRKAVA
jgi:predicted O-linked N-acetylglucosamine transferase (SPINDLY family)